METKIEGSRKVGAPVGFRLFGSTCTCNSVKLVGSIVVGDENEQKTFKVVKCNICGLSRFEMTGTSKNANRANS